MTLIRSSLYRATRPFARVAAVQRAAALLRIEPPILMLMNRRIDKRHRAQKTHGIMAG